MNFTESAREKKIPRDAYRVMPGHYHETLPKMSAGEGPQNIALTYIDCHLYSCTKVILEFLMPRIKHGTIIGFDDYFCFSDTHISGQHQAIGELFDRNPDWELTPYQPIGWAGRSFIVFDRKNSGLPAMPRRNELRMNSV